jgi:hypothetical protein
MKSETLYRKVQHGKRTTYEPASEHVMWDAMPKGTHLICIAPGRRSASYRVDPAHADVLAVIQANTDALCEAIREASAPRPTHKLTKREQAAWAAFKEATGRDSFLMTRASAMCLVDALRDACIKAL